VNPQFYTFTLADIGGALLLPIALLPVAFWIWTIVDCVKRETDGSTKIAWLLIILLVGIIGAPVYFFVRWLPRRRKPGYRALSPLYQPWQKDQRIG
jgi:hypothetical protein